MHVPNYTKEGPLFLHKEPTRRIAWLRPCLFSKLLGSSPGPKAHAPPPPPKKRKKVGIVNEHNV